MRAAQAGDRDAFANLYTTYRPLVATVIAHHLHTPKTGPDVQDLTSEVFLRAWRGIGSVSEQRADPSSWLTVIARNAARDHATSAHRRLSAPVASVADPATGTAFTHRDVAGDWTSTAARHAASAETDFLEHQRRSHAQVLVRDGLARLTPVQRDSVLAILDEEPTADEASRTGSTVGAVKARRSRAIRALRTHLSTDTGSAAGATTTKARAIATHADEAAGDAEIPAPRPAPGMRENPGLEGDDLAAARAAVAAAVDDPIPVGTPTTGAGIWDGDTASAAGDERAMT